MIRTEIARADKMNLMHTPNLCERFLEFLTDDTYPCVGARLALVRGAIETHELGMLGDRNNDCPLVYGLTQLVTMIEANACDNTIVHSCVAIFHGPTDMSERRFESSM